VDKLLLTPEEAAELLGIGRTKLYRLLATKRLDSVRIDGSRRVASAALVEFVGRLVADGEVLTY
jgi:excisionase family DNA binding protein